MNKIIEEDILEATQDHIKILEDRIVESTEVIIGMKTTAEKEVGEGHFSRNNNNRRNDRSISNSRSRSGSRVL